MEDESRSGSCTTTVDEASQPWNLSTVSATSAEGDLSSKPSTPSTSPLHSSAKGCILERRWSSDGQQTEENGPAAPGPQKPAHSLAILSLICNQEAATLGTENV